MGREGAPEGKGGRAGREKTREKRRRGGGVNRVIGF